MSSSELPDLTPDEIKAFRASLGLSQVRFAQIMLISRRTVEDWEKRGAPARERYFFAAINAGLAPWPD
jgi:DNA-binding transcriptional regulator YiaG